MCLPTLLFVFGYKRNCTYSSTTDTHTHTHTTHTRNEYKILLTLALHTQLHNFNHPLTNRFIFQFSFRFGICSCASNGCISLHLRRLNKRCTAVAVLVNGWTQQRQSDEYIGNATQCFNSAGRTHEMRKRSKEENKKWKQLWAKIVFVLIRLLAVSTQPHRCCEQTWALEHKIGVRIYNFICFMCRMLFIYLSPTGNR